MGELGFRKMPGMSSLVEPVLKSDSAAWKKVSYLVVSFDRLKLSARCCHGVNCVRSVFENAKEVCCRIIRY